MKHAFFFLGGLFFGALLGAAAVIYFGFQFVDIASFFPVGEGVVESGVDFEEVFDDPTDEIGYENPLDEVELNPFTE